MAAEHVGSPAELHAWLVAQVKAYDEGYGEEPQYVLDVLMQTCREEFVTRYA